ncbi:MAG: NUDIX hydrolase [Chthonomonadales bacterium]|nr:NUDIX hydrolase [Chthonomonadales bacterium]
MSRPEPIGSRYVYRGRVVTLRLDTLRTIDGREIVREVVEHRGAVAIVPRLDAGTILLVRQFRPAVGEWLLEIPAGTLESDEEADACAARELEEEIGYRPGRLRRMFTQYMAPGYSSERLHAYVADDLEPAKGEADEDEEIQVVPVAAADVERRIMAGDIRDAKSIAALLVALRVP